MKSKGRKGDSGESVIRITGHQLMTNVTVTSTSVDILNNASTAAISPDTLGANFAAVANRYTRYFITDLAFEFVPGNMFYTTAPAYPNTAPVLAIGYSESGELDFATSFDNVTCLQHVILVPWHGYANRKDNTLKIKPSRKINQFYYTEDDTANSATIRQTIQGLLCGKMSQSFGGTSVFGVIIVHYTCLFYDQVPDQGVTLRLLKHELALGKVTKEDIIDQIESLLGCDLTCEIIRDTVSPATTTAVVRLPVKPRAGW
jgi:hypothetical protein